MMLCHVNTNIFEASYSILPMHNSWLCELFRTITTLVALIWLQQEPIFLVEYVLSFFAFVC